LAWARLTPLRETLAQAYECARSRLPPHKILEAVVTCADPAGTPGACYMAAWIAESLGWKIGEGRIRIEVCRQNRPSSWLAIRLEGEGFLITVERLADGACDTRIGDSVRRTWFWQPSEADLLAEELSLGARDLVYPRCLPAAAEAARALG
jgi:glucose-6-phosphate dehydrogenase assembly protein OpcA